MRELAADTPGGIFQVPPYFAYIAKSFSVLEGIGLTVDPNYSIVDETLPYISQRIITDPSPRTAGALETFLFGDMKDEDGRVLDAERVATLVDGAKRYASTLAPAETSTSTTALPAAPAAGGLVPASSSSTSLSSSSSSGALSNAIDLEEAADAILNLLLAREASPLQDIAIEQCALLLGAAGREAFSDLRKQSGSLNSVDGGAGRSRLGLVLDPLGLFRGSPLVENDERDAQSLAAATKLAELANELLPAGLNRGSASTAGASTAGGSAPVGSPNAPLLSSEELRELSSLLAFKVVDRRDDLQLVMRKFAATLLDQASERAFRRNAPFRGGGSSSSS